MGHSCIDHPSATGAPSTTAKRVSPTPGEPGKARCGCFYGTTALHRAGAWLRWRRVVGDDGVARVNNHAPISRADGAGALLGAI